MKKILAVVFTIVFFVLFAFNSYGTEKAVSKELESYKKATTEQPMQEYNFYDVCQRLDKMIQMLEKITDQNEKMIGIMKKNN